MNGRETTINELSREVEETRQQLESAKRKVVSVLDVSLCAICSVGDFRSLVTLRNNLMHTSHVWQMTRVNLMKRYMH